MAIINLSRPCKQEFWSIMEVRKIADSDRDALNLMMQQYAFVAGDLQLTSQRRMELLADILQIMVKSGHTLVYGR